MEIEWYSVSRDSLMYSVSVIALIVVLQDGKIYLSESIALILIYSLYILCKYKFFIEKLFHF